jgi:hypothetical protein
MTLTASELLGRAGEALFGDFWKKSLAKRLGVVERNVYRWLDNSVTPRPNVFIALLGLMRTRRAQLDALITATETYLARRTEER